MGRCIKYPDEDECHGHDCIDRIGTPCFYDRSGKAGTEDIQTRSCPNCEGEMQFSAPWKMGIEKWWCPECGYEEST